MKTNQSKLLASCAAALALASSVFAQTTVSTTTSAGTISEFSPDTIVIRSETSPEPLRYTYTKTTTYVDDAGAPVSMDIVKSGLPVTVYYVKQGDRLIANRVIVKRTTTTTAPSTTTTTTAPVVVPAPAPPVVEEKTTTTTTTTK